MKKIYFLLLTLLISAFSFGQTVFINEIHYDDAGGDAGEGVEIAGPAGTDLSTYTLTPYNGNGGAPYSATSLSGTIPNEGGTGYGTVFFAITGLQNGAPDGIALDNGGALVQFLSYEGSFAGVGGVANGVTSTDIGVSEDGTVEGMSLQLIGTGNVYTDFTWSAQSASSYNLINPGQTFGAASPTVIINSPSDAAVFAPGTTSVDVVFSTNNLVGGETVDITVNGSTTTGVTSPFNIVTTDGTTYNVTVDLVNGSVIDSDMVSFSVASLNTVADIAALRTDVTNNGEGRYYQITGGSLVSHTDSFNNRKWVQDNNISGMLIYDSGNVITTTYNVGDMVTGLRGYTQIVSGVLRFIPTSDSGVVASTGNAVIPQVVTIAAVNAAPNNYESELIQLNNVTFVAGDGVATFGTGQNYDVTDGGDTIIKRTDFFSADYIGQLIPSGSLPSLVAISGQFNGTAQIYVRSLSDFTLSVDQFETNNFSIYPNPTSIGFVTITSNNSEVMSVAVYDILGKQVINQTINNNNRLNVSGLNSGIYIIKISQNNASVTKKLVIK